MTGVGRQLRDWLGFLVLAGASPAVAQIQRTPVESAIPFNYDVGRNVAVLDRSRPELDPIGYQFGTFVALPSLDLGGEASNNVYSTPANTTGDTAFRIAPAITMRSNWNRHYLRLRASGNILRFADQTLRNEDGWNVSTSGILNIDRSTRLYFDGGTARLFETRFTGATPENAASAVPYDRSFAAFRITYSSGRILFSAAADYYAYDFKSIRLFDGQQVNQDNRDRDEARLTSQVAYKFSDVSSAFVQTSWTDTGYRTTLASGTPNRQSTSLRTVGGLSLDIAGLLRGSIGAGYETRRYRAPGYRNLEGFSIEGQAEIFASPISTFTLTARRVFRDSNTVGSSGYVATGVSARVDHELFRFALLYLSGEYEKDSYQGIDSSARVFRAKGGCRYSFSRSISLRPEIFYGERRSYGVPNGPTFAETGGMLTLMLQR